MSFENKGFPNDLDSRYSEMNKQFTRYNEPQTIVNSAGQLIRIATGSGNEPIGAILPKIESPGLKYKRNFDSENYKGEGKEKVKKAVKKVKTEVKETANDLASFFAKLFKGDEEKREERKERRSERKEKRKQRRYKRKGNKIVKLDTEGNETEVVNPAERLQAVQEINTPTERLSETALVDAPLPDIDQPDFIKTDLEGVTITATKKSNSMKYLAIGIVALILVVIAYKLIKKK